jgi:hypothetical protein
MIMIPVKTGFEYSTAYAGWHRLIVEPFRTTRRDPTTGEKRQVTRWRIRTEHLLDYPWVSVFTTSEAAIARLTMLAPYSRVVRVLQSEVSG